MRKTRKSFNFLCELTIICFFIILFDALLFVLLSKQIFPFSEKIYYRNIREVEIEKPQKYLIYNVGRRHAAKSDPKGLNCLVPWDITKSPEKADIFIFDLRTGKKRAKNEIKLTVRPEQYTVISTLESDANYGFSNYQHLFNLTMDYRLTSDVPTPYSECFSFNGEVIPTQNKTGLVAAFISNWKGGRIPYIQELNKTIIVHNYGLCSPNIPVPQQYKRNFQERHIEKMNVIRNYKFTIAFENSVADDYVTEKFYQPLSVGSVPIYRGCQNIRDFAPPHSFIDANEFESVEALGKYLKYLDSNDTAYNEYLEWRKDESNINYGNFKKVRFFRDNPETHICALVERIENIWINPYFTEWKLETNRSNLACRLCLDKYNPDNRRKIIENKESFSYLKPQNFSELRRYSIFKSESTTIYKESNHTIIYPISTHIENIFKYIYPYI